MKVEYTKVIKVEELANLIPTKHGATFSQLWQVFRFTRMFKYISHKHYPQIKSAYIKICTHKNLQTLCRLGYLKNPSKDVYCATNKVLPILREAGFNTELLPQEPVGLGDVNELNNTDVFVQTTKLPYFKMLLYPGFGFLIPDALLVQLDEANRKYKLTFLEIEAKKPKWSEYIDKKKENYVRLSKELTFYNWWKDTAPKMNLPVPAIEKFKFSVAFICSLKNDFGAGFTFTDNIQTLSV